MHTTDRIKVFVVHDDPIAHAGLSAAFNGFVDFEVLAQAGAAADDRLNGHGRWHADVVVADYANGTALAHGARHRDGAASAPVVIVAGNDGERDIRSALASGVRGYILTGCPLDELAESVRSAYRGSRHLSPRVAARLAESIAGESLTGREEEVLRLVVEGLGNKAIARRLSIAVGTVKSHLKGVFDKLGVESRTQAICSAARRGLLQDMPANPVSNGVSAMTHGGASSSAAQMSRSQSQQW